MLQSSDKKDHWNNKRPTTNVTYHIDLAKIY